MPTIVLSGPERIEIRNALLNAFNMPSSFSELLVRVDKNPSSYAGQAEPHPAAILLTVLGAESEGWLLQLLQKAVELREHDLALNWWADELVRRQPPVMANPARVYDTCCLSGNHLLIDRRALRGALRSLAAPNGKRILIVKDDPPQPDPFQARKTGKSHTLQMIAYLSQVQRSFEFIEIDLQPMAQAISQIRPIDLARRLAKKLGWSVSLTEPTDAAWDRWNLDFCDDLEVYARQRSQPVWIVIDSFNLVLMPTPTIGLLRELTVRINHQMANVRLVLLGYGDILPTAVTPIVEEERIAQIGEAELIEFFASAFPERNIPATHDSVADAVERVFELVDPREPDFLIKLPSVIESQLQPPATPAGTPPAGGAGTGSLRS
jgi:hypothetical protein